MVWMSFKSKHPWCGHTFHIKSQLSHMVTFVTGGYIYLMESSLSHVVILLFCPSSKSWDMYHSVSGFFQLSMFDHASQYMQTSKLSWWSAKQLTNPGIKKMVLLIRHQLLTDLLKKFNHTPEVFMGQLWDTSQIFRQILTHSSWKSMLSYLSGKRVYVSGSSDQLKLVISTCQKLTY